ncbi:hypothetical protein D3C80_364540 [compost metagenome]
MTHKKLLLVSILAIACSCQNLGNKQAQESANNATKTDSSTKSLSQPVDENTTQISAQDSLFDDGSIPTSWANAGFNNSTDFKHFLIKFKDWVKTDNQDSIAAHIKFPLKNVNSAAAFKHKYVDLFDTTLKKTIEEQRLDRIFRNTDGAMIGNGVIWFSESNNNYYIIAINK